MYPNTTSPESKHDHIAEDLARMLFSKKAASQIQLSGVYHRGHTEQNTHKHTAGREKICLSERKLTKLKPVIQAADCKNVKCSLKNVVQKKNDSPSSLIKCSDVS